MERTVLTTIILSFLNIHCFGQVSVGKAWLGNNLEFLKLSDTTVFLDAGSSLETYSYRVSKDTLVLIKYYNKVNDATKKTYSKEYPYLTQINNNTLVIKPASHKATINLRGKKEIRFIDISTTYNTPLNFENIYMSTSGCSRSCIQLKVQIDSTGNVHYYGSGDVDIPKGYFRGKMIREQLEEFKQLLKRSQIGKFPATFPHAYDSNMTTYILQNGENRKKSSGNVVPYVGKELEKYMYHIHDKVRLEKSNEKFLFLE